MSGREKAHNKFSHQNISKDVCINKSVSFIRHNYKIKTTCIESHTESQVKASVCFTLICSVVWDRRSQRRRCQRERQHSCKWRKKGHKLLDSLSQKIGGLHAFDWPLQHLAWWCCESLARVSFWFLLDDLGFLFSFLLVPAVFSFPVCHQTGCIWVVVLLHAGLNSVGQLIVFRDGAICFFSITGTNKY